MKNGAPYTTRRGRVEFAKFARREARLRKSGHWGEWQVVEFPKGTVGLGGWGFEITTANVNDVFSVLLRPLGDGILHLAVSSLTGIRPTWYEMQRIKDDIAGPKATAVEIYPPQSEIVDGANMYHIWVLPNPLPFSFAHH